MASVDAAFAIALWGYGIPSMFLCFCFVYFVGSFNNLKQKWYAYFMDLFSFHDVTDDVKGKAFETLRTLKSADLELRNLGLVRILEIGVGQGANLQHLPKNCHLIVQEPNRHTFQKLARNLQRFPHVRLKRYLEGVAEDMSAVGSATVDAVVSTGVLCTVRDLRQTLAEVHRILAPGGKFLFIEHIQQPTRTWQHLLQALGNPLWKIIFDGCHVNRDIAAAIREVPFLSVSFNRKNLCHRGYWDILVGRTLIGVATK